MLTSFLTHLRQTFQDFSLNHSLKAIGSTLLEGDDRRKPSSKSGHWTHSGYRWLIDRLTSLPYSRWRSKIVDRLLVTIETGGVQDNV